MLDPLIVSPFIGSHMVSSQRWVNFWMVAVMSWLSSDVWRVWSTMFTNLLKLRWQKWISIRSFTMFSWCWWIGRFYFWCNLSCRCSDWVPGSNPLRWRGKDALTLDFVLILRLKLWYYLDYPRSRHWVAQLYLGHCGNTHHMHQV